MKLKCLNLIFIFFITCLCLGQENLEPLLFNNQKLLKNEYFNINTLIQAVADFQQQRSFSGKDGFSIAAARLQFRGNLDKGFSYKLQLDFSKSKTLLDAKLRYKFMPNIAIDMGVFKSPFSSEYLTYAADIDFINRSQVVSTLSPKRQIGIQLNGWNEQKIISAHLGIFNGNGFAGNTNDNNEFLYVARLEMNPKFTKKTTVLKIGLNVANSKDEGINIGNGFLPIFAGERNLIGADIRFNLKSLLISGEFISAKFNPKQGNEIKPHGFFATIAYSISKRSQFLLRWDSFVCDEQQIDTNLIIVGWNYFPTSPTELQINYVLPTENNEFKQQILINAQISL